MKPRSLGRLPCGLIGVAAVVIVAMALTRPATQTPVVDARPVAQFRAFLADDATFRVALPVDWEKAGSATLEDAKFFSRQGESFSLGQQIIFTNEAVLNANLNAYRVVLTPDRLVLMSRLLSPPLHPPDVIARLYPQIAGGSIRGMRILESQPLPYPVGQVAFIRFQYTLLPQQDQAFAATLAPTLRQQKQVSMEGISVVSTSATDVLTWNVQFGTIEGPTAVFSKSGLNYVRIFQTVQFIPRGLMLKIQNNAQMQELAADMNRTTRDVAHRWWLRLGGLREFGPNPHSPGGTIPDLPEVPGWEWFQCAGDRYPFQYPGYPIGGDCRKVPAPQ